MIDEILLPLGMTNTFYNIPGERHRDLATIYGMNKDGSLIPVQENSESEYIKGTNYARGSNSLVSTIDDYVKFGKFVLSKGLVDGKRFISEELMASIFSNQLTDDLVPIVIGPKTFGGLGYSNGFSVSMAPNPYGIVPGTVGWIGASHTVFFVDPVNEIVGVQFTQFVGMNKINIIEEFNNLVYEDLDYVQ